MATTMMRFARRMGAAVLVCAAATAGVLGNGTPARADDGWRIVIAEYKVYDNDPWPFQGQCRASAEVAYSTASRKVKVETRTNNTSAISACRVKIEVPLTVKIFGLTFDDNALRADIATSCSTTDLSCTVQPQPGEAGRGWSWSVDEMDFSDTFKRAEDRKVPLDEIQVTAGTVQIKRR